MWTQIIAIGDSWIAIKIDETRTFKTDQSLIIPISCKNPIYLHKETYYSNQWLRKEKTKSKI